jgi:hypothetical protein
MQIAVKVIHLNMILLLLVVEGKTMPLFVTRRPTVFYKFTDVSYEHAATIF